MKITHILPAIAATLALADSASAAVSITNGDFNTGASPGGGVNQDVGSWFERTNGAPNLIYTEYTYNGADVGAGGTNYVLGLGMGSGPLVSTIGYIYQNIGTFDAGTTGFTLNFTGIRRGTATTGIAGSFTGVNATIYVGTGFAGVDGTDIASSSLASFGSGSQAASVISTPGAFGSAAYSFTISNNTDSFNTGDDVWIRLERGTSGQEAFLDNLTVTAVPEPSAALLGGLGMLALLRRRRA